MTFPVAVSWYTPAEIVDAARAVMEYISLDPASCREANRVVKADVIFSKEDDGLSRSWHGNIWLNAPTETIDRFADKLLAEYRLGNVNQAVMFTHNATHEDWHQLLSIQASVVCFPEGRITHWRPTGNGGREYFTPQWGQSIFYFGVDTDPFRREFGKFGTVWTI